MNPETEKELRAEIRRLDRLNDLLSLYGRMKFGDEWWPGNAEPWVGKRIAHEMHRKGIDQGQEGVDHCAD